MIFCYNKRADMKIVDEKSNCIVCGSIHTNAFQLCATCYIHYLQTMYLVTTVSQDTHNNVILHLKINHGALEHTDTRCCANCKTFQYGVCKDNNVAQNTIHGFCLNWRPDGMTTMDRIKATFIEDNN